jgi:hypothetical protein
MTKHVYLGVDFGAESGRVMADCLMENGLPSKNFTAFPMAPFGGRNTSLGRSAPLVGNQEGLSTAAQGLVRVLFR